jgi:hypothetical protein
VWPDTTLGELVHIIVRKYFEYLRESSEVPPATGEEHPPESPGQVRTGTGNVKNDMGSIKKLCVTVSVGNYSDDGNLVARELGSVVLTRFPEVGLLPRRNIGDYWRTLGDLRVRSGNPLFVHVTGMD